LPFLALGIAGACLPLFGGEYWGVIATRACVYWVLISGSIWWWICRTDRHRLGRAADAGCLHHQRADRGTVTAELSPFLALAIAGVLGAVFGMIIGLPGAATAHVLFRDDNAWFATIVTQVALAWKSVTGGGIGVPGRSSPGRSAAPGLLLFLLRSGGVVHLDDGEPRS